MKTLFTIVSFTIMSFCLQAQYLDVIDIYFVNDPQDSPLPDTGLTPGDQLILKFDFVNNLPNNQSLLPGDTVAFAWSVLGKRIGNLGTRSWPDVMKNGQAAKLYSHDMIPLPTKSCFSWEVCIWPEYNSHYPNTDSTKGRYCQTFKTSGCTGNETNTARLTEDNSAFYLSNRVLYFKFSEHGFQNKLELLSLSGKTVFAKNVQNEGSISIDNNIQPGVYLLKCSNANSHRIQKVFIQ